MRRIKQLIIVVSVLVTMAGNSALAEANLFTALEKSKCGENVAYVKVIAEDGVSEKVYTFTINRSIAVEGIALEKSKLKVDYAWFHSLDPIKVEATVFPLNASNKSVIWTSSNEKIASIDTNGWITTTKIPGKTNITATTVDGNFKAVCNLIIKNSFYNSIHLYAVPKKNNYDAKDYRFKKKRLELNKAFKISVYNTSNVFFLCSVNI